MLRLKLSTGEDHVMLVKDVEKASKWTLGLVPPHESKVSESTVGDRTQLKFLKLSSQFVAVCASGDVS